MANAARTSIQAAVSEKLDAHPDYRAAIETLRGVERPYAAAVAREERAKARIRSQRTAVLKREDVTIRAELDAAQGREIAAGGRLAALPAELELAAAQEEQRLLVPLLVAARTELDAVRERLSGEMRRRLAPEAARIRKRMAAATQEVADAHAELAALFDGLRAAGYSVWTDQL